VPHNLLKRSPLKVQQVEFCEDCVIKPSVSAESFFSTTLLPFVFQLQTFQFALMFAPNIFPTSGDVLGDLHAE